ncbi:MFS transporter [Bosea sp. (in: a-proteobacteria)]
MDQVSFGVAEAGLRAKRERYVLIAVGAVYAAFGILVALIQGAMPAILRAKGLSVAQASLVFLLYLPFGLSFLWAPVVDRLRPPVLTRRIGWILTMQGVVVAGLLAVAFAEDGSLLFLALAGFGIAIAAATMDLALDALTVDMAGERTRPLAAAFKLAGLSLGAILGGGIVLGVLQTIGWRMTFLLVAVATIVATLPILLLVADDRAQPRSGERRGNAFAVFIRRRHMALRLGALLLVATTLFPLTMLNRMMLVDLGMNLDQVGWIVGTLQPICLLGASLVSGTVAIRLGSRTTLAFLTVLAAFSSIAMLIGFSQGLILLAVVGAIVISVAVGAVFVVMGAHILDWAQGGQAATDYAIMFNGSRLVGALAAMAAGGIVTAIGWNAFYAGGVVALVLAMLFLSFVVKITNDGLDPSVSQFSGVKRDAV